MRVGLLESLLVCSSEFLRFSDFFCSSTAPLSFIRLYGIDWYAIHISTKYFLNYSKQCGYEMRLGAIECLQMPWSNT